MDDIALVNRVQNLEYFSDHVSCLILVQSTKPQLSKLLDEVIQIAFHSFINQVELASVEIVFNRPHHMLYSFKSLNGNEDLALYFLLTQFFELGAIFYFHSFYDNFACFFIESFIDILLFLVIFLLFLDGVVSEGIFAFFQHFLKFRDLLQFAICSGEGLRF